MPLPGIVPLPSKVAHTLKGHEGPVLCCRFSSGGRYALTGSQDRNVRLWNPHNGAFIKEYAGHANGVHDICVVKENDKFASGGADKLVWLWDVEKGKPIRKFRGHQDQVNSLAFNKEDSLLITGSNDRMVCLWDLRADRKDTPTQVITDAKDSVSKVLFTDDMSCIYSASVDGCIREYDLRKGQLRVDHVGHALVDLAVTRDSNCLLAGSLDSTLRLFERGSAELLASYTGHTNTANKTECILTNTDAHVLTGSEDGQVIFYDLVEEKQVHSIQAHKGCVASIDYHPQQVCLLTAGVDWVCKVWK